MKRWLSAGLVLALFLPSSAGGRDEAIRDRWFIISLGGAKVGSYHQLTRPDGDDPALIRTTDEMTIVLNRLGSKVTMISNSDSRGVD